MAHSLLQAEQRMTSGQIQVIFGPMFSGKTTELLRRVKRYEIALHRCVIIKYANDTRYDTDQVATHDSQKTGAVAAMVLSSVMDIVRTYTVIGIDEGQFFPDIVEFSEEMANNGKIVIVAALDGTYERKGFNNILNLVPLAEDVVKLTAVCMNCYKDASYTKRRGSEQQIEVIGGADKYMAVCRKCYVAMDSSPQKFLQPLRPHYNCSPVKKQLFEIKNNCETVTSAKAC